MRLRVNGERVFFGPRGSLRSVRLGGEIVIDKRDGKMGPEAVRAALLRFERRIFWLDLEELGADLY